jgi:hypothetical protein
VAGHPRGVGARIVGQHRDEQFSDGVDTSDR